MTNVQDLVPLFGSSREIARAAGVNKSAVVRWRQGKHPVQPIYQARLLEAAEERKLDRNAVAEAIGVPRCPHCGHYHVVA
jgi:transcriptional regulator with XRE-family HTH domain